MDSVRRLIADFPINQPSLICNSESGSSISITSPAWAHNSMTCYKSPLIITASTSQITISVSLLHDGSRIRVGITSSQIDDASGSKKPTTSYSSVTWLILFHRARMPAQTVIFVHFRFSSPVLSSSHCLSTTIWCTILSIHRSRSWPNICSHWWSGGESEIKGLTTVFSN